MIDEAVISRNAGFPNSVK